ncbi:MAG: hypothetical protein CMG69_00145 [Candidatus Marinimicrobia bacterium]|nr:hypothetical protein [Candidatus Neomarinimicrobiota bacterium]|tara:strand:+ start:9343 stop:10305 length:963 start_codon:yes stop_codon:yes gene_type:complete
MKNISSIFSTSLGILLFIMTMINAQDFARFPGAFLRMGITAREVSMGSALVADIYGGVIGVSNPAGTAFLEQKHGTVGHQILSLDRQLSSVGVSMKLPPTAGIGIAWIHAGVDNIEERNSLGEYSGRLSTGEDAFIISFAQNYKGIFSAGLNVKILSHALPVYGETLNGSAVGFDLGFFYKINDYVQIGGVVQNLNAKYKWKTNSIFEETGTINYDNFPVIFRLGVKARYENLNFLCESELITDDSYLLGKRLNGGIEYSINETIKLRAGLGKGKIGMGFGHTFNKFQGYEITVDYSSVFNEVQKFNNIAHVITSSITFD